MRSHFLGFNIWILIAIALLPFAGFWLYGLTDLDEGFYGAVTMNMIRDREWIVPLYNGTPWFEKPILSYWLAIPFLWLGPSDLGARLPSFLCTIATIWVIFRFAQRHYGDKVALLSSLIYATSLLVVGIGRMMLTDGPFNLCLVLALTLFFDSLVYSRVSLRLWSAFALGLSMLAKGPVGPAFFVLIFVILAISIRELRPSFKGGWIIGSLIFMLTVSTWYLPVYLRQPDTFVSDFLIKQNIGRFRGGDTAHGVEWYLDPIYFPLILAFNFGPWLLSIQYKRMKQGIETDHSPNVTRFLWIWALVVLVFFTISGTKLPHYILPAVAPFAILIAHILLSQKEERFATYIKRAAFCSAIVCAIANLFFAIYHRDNFAEIQALAKGAEARGDHLIVLGFDGGEPSEDQLINKTSHPSVLFYYWREEVALDPDSWELEIQPPSQGSTTFIIRKSLLEKFKERLIPGEWLTNDAQEFGAFRTDPNIKIMVDEQ